MPKLIVELKQHTPIYHFQYGDSGVTIRSTELKSALDRFLLTHDTDAVKRFMIKSHEDNKQPIKALDYRLKIQAPSTSNPSLRPEGWRNIGSFPPSEKNDKELVYCNDFISITFLTAHNTLLDCIKKWIGPFMASHNFGYQKLKGFGSYSVAKIGGDNYETSITADMRKALGNEPLYEISAEMRSNIGWDNALAKAAAVRSSLRALFYKTNQRKESPFLFKPVFEDNMWRVYVIKRDWNNTDIAGATLDCKNAAYKGRKVASQEDYNIIVGKLLNTWKENGMIKEVKSCE